MRRRLITLGATCALVIGGMYLSLSSHDSEVLLVEAASLTTGWTEFRSPSPMRTTGDWSELYVEMLNIHEDANDNYAFEDGTSISVEAYLVSKSGEKLDLDAHMNVGGFGLTRVLRLSSPALGWKRRDYKFSTLMLRANRPLTVGRIVWISYDPQSTKTGTKVPDAFSDNASSVVLGLAGEM